MNNKRQNGAIRQRTSKITLLFWLIVIGMLIFLFAIFKTVTTERRIPSHNTTIYDRSFRGSIISADGYTLSASQKTYKAVVRGASIVPQKREVFIKLFSIYSGIKEEEIYKRFRDKKGDLKKGNIILSKNLDFQAASQLKALSYKLRKLGVFRSIKTRSGIEVLYGLDIVEVGESRCFPKHDIMSPVLGYVSKKEEKNYRRPEGQKGLEKRYEAHITSKKDGYFRGKRDVIGAVIHDKNSINIKRVDGLDLHLNTPLALQRRIELMIDNMRDSIDADEILIGIMESHTGKVLALASTNRYDPAHIQQEDMPALNPKFSEYPYEPGSVMKPITLAVALDNHVVRPDSRFDTGYRKFRIGKNQAISDDEFFESQTATDIIVHSSNIGISQIAWRLSGRAYREGLLKFGFAKPTGIDLSRDLPGMLKPLYKLNNKTHRASSSYGYGMTATFAQLFKAYSAFNNDGIAVTPRIVNYLQDAKGNHYTLNPKVGNLRAISKKTANQIHDILCEVVKRGTGVKAQYPGLEIGGKTGTAHIVKGGHYVREYHSSFYGFANDKRGHRYTIGVLVIRAKAFRKYFAAQSAVPTFKNAVRILVDQGYLVPDPAEVAKTQENDKKPHFDTAPSATQKEAIDVYTPLPHPQKADKSSVKSLFKFNKSTKKRASKQPLKKEPSHTTPKPKPKTSYKRHKPIKQEPTHELFEDLF